MSEALLPRLPYVVTFEEELPVGHKDKLPKALGSGGEWVRGGKSFQRTKKGEK